MMNDDAIGRYLEGELPRGAVPEDLEPELRVFERAMDLLRDELKAPPPDLAPPVMTRVRTLRRSPWRRALAWATAPTIRLSPATGALALAAAAAVVLIARPAPEPSEPAPAVATAGTAMTRFVFVAPSASSVAVTGDFVAWDPDGLPMSDEAGTGVWVAEVELQPGLHHYVFVVDGTEWRPDPNATSQVDDGFGQENSVLIVAPRSAS